MSNDTDEREALAAMGRLEHCGPIMLYLTPMQALVALSNLQLACRHPGNVGPSSQIAEAVARMIQDGLAEQDELLGLWCERGWHEVFDVPRAGPSEGK